MTGGSRSDKEKLKKARELLFSFVEEVGADAVIVVWSASMPGKTTIDIEHWGNALTCNGLADYIAENFSSEIDHDFDDVEEDAEDPRGDEES